MSAENKSIVYRLYEEVWNKRKLRVVDEVISSSHALHDPTVSGSQTGPGAYRQQVARFTSALPDLHLTIEHTVSEQDKVVVSWVISGTHKGEFLGIPPTNKKISVEGITINHIANGKILDSYISWDALGLMRQLSHAPSLGKTIEVGGSHGLKAKTTSIEGVIVVYLSGAILFDEESASLRALVKDLLKQSHQIVLDLRDVTHIDSAGLGTLVGLYLSARSLGGAIKFADVGGYVNRSLQITKLVNVFQVFDKTEDAIASFHKAAAAT
jgi:steroid delta-isomerase-like uncharacterized protein